MRLLPSFRTVKPMSSMFLMFLLAGCAEPNDYNPTGQQTTLEISYRGGGNHSGFATYSKKVIDSPNYLESISNDLTQEGLRLVSGFGQLQQPLCASDDLQCVTEKDLPSSAILDLMYTAQCFHNTHLGLSAFDSYWVRTGSGQWSGQANRSMIRVGSYPTLCFLSSARNNGGRIEAVGMGEVTVKSSKMSRPRLDLLALGWGQVGWTP